MAKRKPARGRRPAGVDTAPDLGPEVRRKTIVQRDPRCAKPAVVLRGPTVLHAEWRDPDDTDASRRAPKVVTGARAANPLIAMHKRGGLINLDHIAAAERLLTSYEVGILGGHPGRGREYGEPHVTSRPRAYPQEVQLAALAQFRAAMRRLSPFQVRLVGHVVLGIPDPARRDVAVFAERAGLDANVVRGQLVAALDALVKHFFPAGAGDVEREIDGLVGVV